MTKKINLGCGWRNFGPDWIHIDGGDYDHLDHKDIIDFPYENIDLIYASHVLEYFDRDEIVPILKTWKSKLRPGGILRLAVPDFNNLYAIYQSTGNIDKVLGPLYGKMPMGDKTIYHKTVYDHNSLVELLDSLGFRAIQTWDWREVEHGKYDDHSQAYYPHMDKENGIPVSLNIEAYNGI